jgi:hypothetical protein
MDNKMLENRAKQKQDYKYFWRNMEKLYKEYGHRFLVIKNKGVLGAYDTFREALDNASKTEKIGTFLVQECFEKKADAIRWLPPYVEPVSG